MLIEKAKGEILGVVIVESGWGSILPTVIIANMMHAGPAERSGRLNIGDQPLSTCQSIIKVCPSGIVEATLAASTVATDTNPRLVLAWAALTLSSGVLV